MSVSCPIDTNALARIMSPVLLFKVESKREGTFLAMVVKYIHSGVPGYRTWLGWSYPSM